MSNKVMVVNSDTYSANLRSEPAFGENVIGELNQCDPVQITGPQTGDRWLPVVVVIDGTERSAFISKNIVRERESDARERLAQVCIKEWLRFDRGSGKETNHPFIGFVGEYWNALGLPYDGSDTSWPWASAFNSFCIRAAGGYGSYKYSASDSVSVNDSIRKKVAGKNSPFWGFEIDKYSPKVGDMITFGRGSFDVTYDHAAEHDNFMCHSDFVTGVHGTHLSIIGGNIENTVSRKNYRLDENGFLINERRVFLIRRNNL